MIPTGNNKQDRNHNLKRNRPNSIWNARYLMMVIQISEVQVFADPITCHLHLFTLCQPCQFCSCPLEKFTQWLQELQTSTGCILRKNFSILATEQSSVPSKHENRKKSTKKRKGVNSNSTRKQQQHETSLIAIIPFNEIIHTHIYTGLYIHAILIL